MIQVPEEIERIARSILNEGYTRCEAYPIDRWRRNGWPEDPIVFSLVDASIKILKSIESYHSSKS